ncbi:abc transporter [Lucifera butyrica]|uniref:Abc transporter n=1 Tax=Lucifera butyrica TaxID=1351585 RepID=A0A498R8R0_9FIRM|nr:ATP-binding cassette domain-containing protein [Lucifera butyrica]VBB07589.1 abc transporter [Lucifera butyrica]
MELIWCDKIRLTKNGQDLLQHVSFTVEQGEFVGIAGPSGSGKTSLLRIMNLLHSPTEGIVMYKGKNITSYDPVQLRREVGYVLQKPYLFEGTVRDNLEYPYLIWKQKPDEEEITAYLERVNLTAGILKKRGSELSGGEQQRVAFVRSLLAKPEVLLLDEISAALDEENTLVLEQLIRTEHEDRNTTVLFVSHNTGQLRRLARKIIYIEKGQVIFSGPAEEFFQIRGGLKNE